jgi:hypothetical protein
MARDLTYRSPFATARPSQPSKPQLEAPKPAASKPMEPKPPAPPDRHASVTVKLPGPLLAKLDRLVKRHSGTLARAGRSTVLRWLLDQYQE